VLIWQLYYFVEIHLGRCALSLASFGFTRMFPGDAGRYEAKNNWPSNQFADNWLYEQRFDRHMRPTSPGRILGIPAPKQWWVGDGPIEPRLVAVAGRVLVTFNAAMAFAQQTYMDYTVLWDINSDLPIIPRIEGGQNNIAKLTVTVL